MGGEGAQWIGRAPFTDRPHLFRNLGDGTFFPSGSMAIRACVAAGVSITFKLLYNRAVTMTGGQHAAGEMAEPELAGRLTTIVCAEDLARTTRARDGHRTSPSGRVIASTRPSERCREIEGVTVLIYDQDSAAEKRRLRKRGRAPIPPSGSSSTSGCARGVGL